MVTFEFFFRRCVIVQLVVSVSRSSVFLTSRNPKLIQAPTVYGLKLSFTHVSVTNL